MNYKINVIPSWVLRYIEIRLNSKHYKRCVILSEVVKYFWSEKKISTRYAFKNKTGVCNEKSMGTFSEKHNLHFGFKWLWESNLFKDLHTIWPHLGIYLTRKSVLVRLYQHLGDLVLCLADLNLNRSQFIVSVSFMLFLFCLSRHG